jgi:two-component system, OmpR family, sensor histidine kinase KdpD
VARGSLRIFLGAVAGVGKTYAMLNEAWRKRDRGLDVVIGFVETHGRVETADQIRDLEIVPRRQLEHRGGRLEEMDVDAVLARRPQLCVVDELAHTNVPGSRHPKRWQDVAELLDAGIDVLSTLNIQHLESLNDVVEHITGVRQHETIPDEFVRSADEIQLVELTPEALRRRLEHGDIYPPDRVDAALANFFRPGNLGALRELALMWVADRVDADLHHYMAAHDIQDTWETRERVLVALTGGADAEHVVRRAARIAGRAHGELLGLHVRAADGLVHTDTSALAEHRRLLTALGGRFIEVFGDDIPTTLLSVARDERVTQIVLGASRRSRVVELTRGSIIAQVLRGAGDIDVHVISSPAEPGTVALPRPKLGVLSARRRLTGIGFSSVVLTMLTAALLRLEPGLELSSVLLLYLTVTVVATSIGGGVVALPTGVGAVALTVYHFTSPEGTFVIADLEVIIAILVFTVVTALTSWLVDRAARRSRAAQRAGAETAAIARVTSVLTSSEDPLPTFVDELVRTFDLDGAAVLTEADAGWRAVAAAGVEAPSTPEAATDVLSIADDHVLALRGHRLFVDDRRVLATFAGQLALALTARQLEARAAAARLDADRNRLRAALLSAVSHDLRTPLAAIKANASSLIQSDVTWRSEDVEEFARSIVEESDRLNALITNLLDMSRLEADGVTLRLQPVGLDDLVPAVLHTLPFRDAPVVVELPGETPAVLADPTLLERIVANLLDNALRWSPPAAKVTVRSGADGGERVRLEIIDRGPGVPDDAHEHVFQPFQRFGDAPHGGQGIGLGLAVARGFARALGGDVTLERTQGGGTTATVSLPIAHLPPRSPDAPEGRTP